MEHIPQTWTGGIDELVSQANARLLAVLPQGRAARPKDEVNPRLVRHYTTQGLLPTPWREGREARYGALHLLHLLALRRLMADGLSGMALYAALDGKTLEQLTELVTQGAGGLEGLTLPSDASFKLLEEASEDSNPALRYLQSLKRKAVASAPTLEGDRFLSPGIFISVPEDVEDVQLAGKLSLQRLLRHVEVRPGLEVQIASDFEWPENKQQWQVLMDELRALMHAVAQEP